MQKKSLNFFVCSRKKKFYLQNLFCFTDFMEYQIFLRGKNDQSNIFPLKGSKEVVNKLENYFTFIKLPSNDNVNKLDSIYLDTKRMYNRKVRMGSPSWNFFPVQIIINSFTNPIILQSCYFSHSTYIVNVFHFCYIFRL